MTLFAASKLLNVHPDLVRLAAAAGRRRDVQVVEGARSLSAEEDAIAAGRSALHDAANSKHVLTSERTQALAVDLAPVPLVWENIPAFASLATVVLSCASELGIAVTWGGNWNHFRDYDHFELIRDYTHFEHTSANV